MGMAMDFPLKKSGCSPFKRQDYAPPYPTQHSSKDDKKGFNKIEDFKTCKLSHTAA